MITVTRRLEWDAMHRVPGHDGACKAFHGHRYRAEITCQGDVPENGMIIDFGAIKAVVGSWIDQNWDHTAILYHLDQDPAVAAIKASNASYGRPVYEMTSPPTAENIAAELLKIASALLERFGISVTSVRVYETPNCFATATKS